MPGRFPRPTDDMVIRGKSVLSVGAGAVGALTAALAVATCAGEATRGPSAAASLHDSALEPLTLRWSGRGTVRAVFGAVASPASTREQKSDPYAAAEAFFRHHREAFGVGAETVFEPKRIGRSSGGNRSVHFAQRHAGLRVLLAGAVVKFGEAGAIEYAVYDFDPFVDVDPNPAIGPDEAASTAASLLTDAAVPAPPELVACASEFDPRLRRDALAWTLVVEGRDRQGRFRSLSVLIDAHTGRILGRDDNFQTRLPSSAEPPDP